MDTFLSIDTETTGLSFVNDRVIQFGMAVFVRRVCVHKTSFYIANTSVPNGGFHINQISDETIASGLDPEYAFTMISVLLFKFPRIVLAYNAPFDLSMLAAEFIRYGIHYDYSRLRIIDPLVIHKHYNPRWPAPRNKLVHVCDRYRIPYEGSHDAGDDCEAAGHLFMAQRTHFGLRGDVGKLHSRQATWHKEWADSFIEYCKARNREVTVTPWPYAEEYKCFLPSEQSSLPW